MSWLLTGLGRRPCLCPPWPLTNLGAHLSSPLLPALPPWSLQIMLFWNTVCWGSEAFWSSFLQGAASKCENSSPSPEAQPSSGAEQDCAPWTDTIAKQTVVLCRVWGGSAHPHQDLPHWRRLGWGSSQSNLSQTLSLAICKLKSFPKAGILATCWFCKHPVTFIYSLVICSFQDFNKFVSFSARRPVFLVSLAGTAEIVAG